MRPAEAIQIIRACIAANRVTVREHFARRMDERSLFWPDVQAVVDAPTQVRADGCDDYDRARWLIIGKTPDSLRIQIVAVLDQDDGGHWTVLFTLHYL